MRAGPPAGPLVERRKAIHANACKYQAFPWGTPGTPAWGHLSNSRRWEDAGGDGRWPKAAKGTGDGRTAAPRALLLAPSLHQSSSKPQGEVDTSN